MREQHGPIKEQHNPHPPEGQRKLSFGNYDLVRRIDIGGMGEVYLARQRTAFGRLVAIKIIRSDLVHDPIARQRFLREAEVNSKLLHEHIPSLIEFNEEQGQLFFVTPYISGGTLAQRLQSGPLTLQETHTLFTALLSAVAYIHRHGVVHRDLKPSNILLDTEMEPGRVYVRLIDFGIASDSGYASDPRLTQAGTEMGTVVYMAPERLNGTSAPSNDIYSLGMMLHQMLTGQLPSAGRHASLPESLEYVVNRCITARPEERFASADEVLKAFENAYQYLNSPQPVAAATGAQASLAGTGQESVTLQQSERPPALSPQQNHNGFASGDYASPTVNVHVLPRRKRDAAGPPGKRRRSPLFAIVTLLIVVILLVMAGILFFVYSAGGLVTANVSFSSQAQAIRQVYVVKASPTQTKVDAGTDTIPLLTLNNSRTNSLSGSTTGQQCILFYCQPTVAQSDADALTAQLRQKLDGEISQSLQQQLAAKGGTAFGPIQYVRPSAVAYPPVGAVSKTVTVTITGEMGQLTYFMSSDAQSLARIQLEQSVQKLGTNYHLVSGTEQIGSPVVVEADSNKNVLIDVPAGGVAEYQFPSVQLQQIAASIKSMSEASALAFLKQQPGVDPRAVALHISMGSTMPASTQNIKIVTVTPTTLPSVVLPTVTPAPSATATP